VKKTEVEESGRRVELTLSHLLSPAALKHTPKPRNPSPFPSTVLREETQLHKVNIEALRLFQGGKQRRELLLHRNFKLTLLLSPFLLLSCYELLRSSPFPA